MTTRAPVLACIVAVVALCAGGRSAAQQVPDATSAWEATDAAVRARFPEFEPHFVRVRMFRDFELRRDGSDEVILQQRYELGGFGGIVVTGEPLVLVSGSAATERRPVVNQFLSEVRYEFLLDDGTTIPAVVAQRAASLNLWLLRPAPGVAVPEELRQPLPIPAKGRRPAANEFFGIVAQDGFDVPRGRNGEPLGGPGQKNLITRVGVMPAGKDFYARPAVIFSVGTQDLGMPAIAADGTFLGLVNMQPPEMGIPEWSTVLDPRQMPMDTDRDPSEFAGYGQRPVLLSHDEVLPFLRRLKERAEEPRRFDPLGLVVALRGAHLEVVAVDAEGPLDGRVKPGDAIATVGGIAVASADDFLAALEQALESAPLLQLGLTRDGKPVEASLTLE